MSPYRRRALSVLLTLSITVFILPVFPASAAVSFLGTLAGPSVAAMYDSGLEFDDANSRIVVADTGLDRILFYDENGTNLGGGFGTHGIGPGQFDSPRDVAIGPNSMIFVADAGNNRVQAFTSSGAFLWEHGGTGTMDNNLNTPIGVTWDAANSVVLVASTGQDLIKAFDQNGVYKWQSPGEGQIVNGVNTALNINAPRDVTRGPDGRIWLSDYDHHQVKAFDVTAAGVWTTAPAITLGDGVAQGHGDGQVNFPYNVDFSLDGNTAYVSDTGNNRVAMWNIAGAPGVTPTWIGAFGGNCPETPDTCADPPADFGFIDTLRRVVIDPAGNAITADFWGNGIQIWTSNGTPIKEIELVTPPVPGFAQAFGVATAPGGGIYVIDRLNQRIEQFDPTGAFVRSAGNRGTAAGHFSWPEAIAVASDGTVWVGDTRNDRIQKLPANLAPPITTYGSTGIFAGTTNPGRFNYIEDLDVGPNGLVYITDTRNDRIQTFNPTTSTFGTPFGTAGSGTSNLQNPQGIAVSSTNIYVADTDNNRIQKLDLNGAWVASYSTGLSGPQGVALAPDGSLWVTDTNNNRVVHLSANLVDLGDGFGSLGTGTMQFNLPHTLAVSGNKLYVADTFNNRVQIFDTGTGGGPDTTKPTIVITTPTGGQVFPNGPVGFAGTAADNVGVTAARVAIKDTARPAGSNWWHPDGTWGAYQLQLATLGSPGATSTTWSFNWTPPTTAGSYSLTAQSTDAAGNTTATPLPVRLFSVQAAGGGGPTLNATYNRQVFNAGGVAPLYPAGGATATNGDRYVADSGGSRIVKITSAGVQTTISDVTNGWNDPRDLELDVTDPTVLWVTDTSDSQIVKESTTGGAPLAVFGGPSVYKTPYGLANDASGVYVADTYNQRVLKINKTTGAIIWTQTTCSGKAFLRPRDLAVGSDANIYVTDTDNGRIVLLNPTTGACISAFGTIGTGNANFKSPRSITSDGTGGLWVADAGNNRLMHVSNSGTFIGKIGAFGEGNAQFRSAHCVFRDGALIDVCDTFNYRIQQFTVNGSGVPAFSAIVGGTRPANGGFNGAFDVAYAADGSMFAVDWFNHRIEKFDAAGNFLLAFGGYSSTDGSFIFPRGVTVAPNGEVVVMDSENNRIDVFSSGGTFLRKIKPPTGQTPFSRPYQVAVGPNGTYWVADNLNNRIVNINNAGTVLASWNGGGVVSGPRGIAVDASGNVYVSNTNNRVDKYTSAGVLIAQLATNGTGPTQVKAPYGLRIIGTGANAMLLIADAGNNRVVALTLTGGAVTTFGSTGSGNGQFSSPRGMDRNPLTGEIAVADFTNNRLSIWTT